MGFIGFYLLFSCNCYCFISIYQDASFEKVNCFILEVGQEFLLMFHSRNLNPKLCFDDEFDSLQMEA